MTAGSRSGAIASALINDLQIDLSSSGEAISVRGLMPYSTWIASAVKPPTAILKAIETTDSLIPGVSIRVNEPGEMWPVFFDQESRWIFIGRRTATPVVAVEFLVDCIAAIADDALVGLWLRPRWM